MTLTEIDSPPFPTRLPAEFGPFTLLRLLGEGGMGVVWEGVRSGPAGFRKRVAVKALLPASTKVVERAGLGLVREAQLGALLQHPGIVQTYDCGQTRGVLWLATELVDGMQIGRLRTLLGGLPASVLLDLMGQLLAALDYAHRLTLGGRSVGLVHRDVKAGNVLVDTAGRVRLIDFGVARTDLFPDADRLDAVQVGTPGCMAPEQARGETVDARADVFAVGLLMYALITGRSLFSGISSSERLAQLQKVDELLEHSSALQAAEARIPGVRFVLRGCLQHDPDLRWGSAAEVDDALDEARDLNPGPPAEAWAAALPAGEVFRAGSDTEDPPWLPDECVATWCWPEGGQDEVQRGERPQWRRPGRGWRWPWETAA